MPRPFVMEKLKKTVNLGPLSLPFPAHYGIINK